MGRVFNFKLGCFDDEYLLIYMDARPHLYLKTRPRFSPVSLSLSMVPVLVELGNDYLFFTGKFIVEANLVKFCVCRTQKITYFGGNLAPFGHHSILIEIPWLAKPVGKII